MTTMLAYIKALVAALVAALTSLGTALTDGTVSASEGVSVALAFLFGLGLVAAAPRNQYVDPPELEGDPGDDLVLDEDDVVEQPEAG